MAYNEHQAWIALAAAAGMIRRLQDELRILSSGENALSHTLGSIDIDVAKLRGQPIENVISWIAAEQHRLSRFVSDDDIVQNCALTKVAWLLNNAKNGLIDNE